VIRKLMPPLVTEADTRTTELRRDVRRSFKACLRRFDRIESLHNVDRTDEALDLSPEFVRELGLVTLLLYDIPPGKAGSAPTDASAMSLLLPAGDVRECFSQVIQELQKAEAATAEPEQAAAMEAFFAAARRTFRRVKAVVRDKRKQEWRTPMDVYRRRLAWSVAGTLALVIAAYAAYRPTPVRISIVEATFGHNCDGRASGTGSAPHAVPRGNATAAATEACDQQVDECRLEITPARFGEPAPLCAKDFFISWRCSDNPLPFDARLAPEATGQSVTLSCRQAPRRLQILEATYGANCDGKQSPSGDTYSIVKGNLTVPVTEGCDPTAEACSVTVAMIQGRDPAPLCGKDFAVRWSCTHDGKERTARIEPEALGRTVEVSCR
jgi:hypothetical protein